MGHNFWTKTYKGCGACSALVQSQGEVLYQEWLDLGNEGTYQEFLDILFSKCDDCEGIEFPTNCLDGQVLKWNETTSKWECANDDIGVGGTDTLASLSCLVGQVAKWNGITWVCANDADIDTTIPNTDVLAGLNCVEGQGVKYVNGVWECADDLIGTGGTTDTNITISYGAFRVVCYTDGTGQSQGTCMEEITTNQTDNTSTSQQIYFDKDGNTLDPNLIVACSTNPTGSLPVITGIFNDFVCYEGADQLCHKGTERVDIDPNTNTVVATKYYDENGNEMAGNFTACDCCTVCDEGGIVDPQRTCAWTEDGEECFAQPGSGTLCACPQPVDDLQRRSLRQIKDFLDWADAAGTEAVIFEWGVPFKYHDKSANLPQADIDKYNALHEIVFRYTACRSTPVAPWSTGHEWGNTNAGPGQGYQLNPYEYDSAQPANVTTLIDSPIAPPVTNYFQNVAPRSYINNAGEEFWCTDKNDPWQCTHRPDQAPTAAMLQMLATRGVDSIRYPLGQQPPAGGTDWLFDCGTEAVRPEFIGHVENLFNSALDSGMDVVLDPLHPGNGDLYNTICGQNIKDAGGDALYKKYITSLFNHSWTYNGTTYTVKTHPRLEGVDIVNEPHSNHSNPAMNMSNGDWETWSAQAVLWYRNTLGLGGDKTLFVGTNQYSSVWGTPINHGPIGTALWYTDPAGNSKLSGHYYPDANNAGAFGEGLDTYQENLNAIGNEAAFTVPDCELCCENGTVAGSCEKYTKEVERYTDGAQEICGGTRYKDQGGSVVDVSGLVSCNCSTVGNGNTYVSCERPAGYPVCPTNLSGWHRETGATDADGNPCVVGWNGTGECWFDPSDVPQQED